MGFSLWGIARTIIYLILLLASANVQCIAQINKPTKHVSFIPAVNTKVNGLAIGFMINSMKFNGDTLTTKINGLNIELLGTGFFGPLVPSNSISPYGTKDSQIDSRGKSIGFLFN